MLDTFKLQTFLKKEWIYYVKFVYNEINKMQYKKYFFYY